MPRNPTKPARINKRVDTQAFAKLLAKRKGSGVDTGALLNALIEQWGGVHRFASDIFAEYQQGKPGGMTRQKILEMVARLVTVVTNQQIARPRGAGDMSDDELTEAIEAMIGSLSGGTAPAAPAEAA